jgi:ribonucleoside-diphosphate reductase alpha chain
MDSMFVMKRNGKMEAVHFDKITERISKLIDDNEKKYVDPVIIAQKTVASIYNGITTEELDLESAKICINLCTTHYLYSSVASRILISNLHKKTLDIFVEKENLIQEKLNILDSDWLNWINENKNEINSMIDYSRDYIYDYFGFKTLERAYLIKIGNKIIERPQDMIMRVASFINKGNLELTKKTYDIMSLGYYTHASPTLFNSGNKRSQLSSCFLVGSDDTLEGITKTWSDVSKISKWGGGIGIHISNIRAKDSLIRGTNGPSSGIIPMLKVYNEIARYIDQCFVGTTKIYTKHGLIPIEKIKPGNKVYTNDGTLQKVKRVYCDSYKGKVLNFTISNDYESIKVTPNHPFFVVKNQKIGNNFDVIKNRLKNRIAVPEWIDASNITRDDIIGFPIPTYFKDNEEIDETDCYMYGLMLGDGHICKNKNEAGITLGYKKQGPIDFTIEYLKQHGINYWENKTETTHQIRWTPTSKFKFVRSQIYDENDEKCFDSMMLNLPEEKVKFVLKGILDTDGCINKEITLEMSSQNIIDGVKFILLRMGILCSGYERDRIGNISSYKNIQTTKLTWVLRIPKTEKITELLGVENGDFLKYFEFDNVLYTRIKDITEEEIETNVYDLEIKNNHNYLTQAGLVHNGGKRKGSIAFYLEPHHPDIKAFLELRKNTGAETERARDLFTALWISDLFMKQVENNDDWYLMCPDTCKGLSDVYGNDYEDLYWSYVKENKFKEKVKARDIWQLILESQVETGTPYITFKDSVNKKSNQKNIGVIKSSNLCNEIVEYSDDKEYAVCNLASIAINKFIEPFIFNRDDEWVIYSKDNCKYCTYAKTFLTNKGIKYLEIKNKLPSNANTYPQIYHNDKHIGGYDDLFEYVKGTFSYDKLYDTAYIATKNLNKIIDINYYPVPEAELSNMRHRPIGLGIQGLADALVLLKIPYDSDESIEFNKKMMETIYLAAITASHDLAKENNEGAYSTFKGSPISEGKFQFDLWNIDRNELMYKEKWEELTESIKKYGVRNSLVTALMPTASTSQILGNNECFEFFTNNIYTRRTLAGDFPLVNKYLIDELYDLNLWSNEMKQMIIANNGSISNFNEIPSKIRRLFQTIWEIKQIWTLKNAVARGPFVDQTQSMNIFMPVPDFQKLHSSHFWAWKNGLKTGIYYLRSKPAKEATKITVDNNILNKVKALTEEHSVCENCSA